MKSFAEFLDEALKKKLLDAAVKQAQQRKGLLQAVPGSGSRQMSTKRVYHGTSQGASREISQGGYRTDVGVTRQMRGGGVYTTSDPEVAKKYAANRALKRGEPGSGAVRRFNVPSSTPDILSQGGVGDPSGKGFKMQLLKPEQAAKYDVTGKPIVNLSSPQKGEVKAALKGKTTKVSSFSNPSGTRSLPPAGGTGQGWQDKLRQIAAERQTKREAERVAREARKTTTGLAVRTGENPSIPKAMMQGAQDAARRAGSATATTTAKPSVTKLLSKSKTGLGRLAGPAFAALDVATSAADERAKGSGWARSLAKGATVAAGGLLGGTAGAIGGGGVGSAALGIAGAAAGGAAAEKAFDTVAGANAVTRKAIATANRQSQSGGALKGIGGKTTFDTKKGTMTTGVGSQKKTVQLGKTSVVTDPTTGKQDVGYLAYKGGKAVYKRPETKSLAQTSSNWMERIGRSVAPGAYAQNDAKLAAQKLAQARQSDVKRQQALGVKMGPGK